MIKTEAKETKIKQRNTVIKSLNIYLVTGTVLSLILLPILINILLFSNEGANWVSESVSNAWVGYVGTYISAILGGIISGGLTLLGVRQTIRHSDRQHEERLLLEQRENLAATLNLLREISTFERSTRHLVEHTDEEEELSAQLDETRETAEKLKAKCIAVKELLLLYGLEDVLSEISLFQNLYDAPGDRFTKEQLLDQVIKIGFMNELRREQTEKSIERLYKLDPEYFNAIKMFTQRRR